MAGMVVSNIGREVRIARVVKGAGVARVAKVGRKEC